jgi:hypothetical protein
MHGKHELPHWAVLLTFPINIIKFHSGILIFLYIIWFFGISLLWFIRWAHSYALLELIVFCKKLKQEIPEFSVLLPVNYEVFFPI